MKKGFEPIIKEFQERVSSAAWNLDFFQFCQRAGFDPEQDYAKKKWMAIRALSSNLAKFDAATLEKIITEPRQPRKLSAETRRKMSESRRKHYPSTDAEIMARMRRKTIITPKGCWEWQGYKSEKGYGRMYIDGKTRTMHRVAWKIANGEDPGDYLVRHTCDNSSCWNPEHLLLGTHLENMADRGARGRHHNQGKTHCSQGHPFNESNTYTDKKGWRRCRVCRRPGRTNTNFKSQTNTS
jgi:hypothetical protein